MSSWEERMAIRAKGRRVVAEAEEIARQAAEYVPTHLHGNVVTCPCGAEGGGLTTIAVDSDYEPPDQCAECGKPRRNWHDLQAVRTVERHHRGCPAGPEPALCARCERPVGSGVRTFCEGEAVHFECYPGVQTRLV